LTGNIALKRGAEAETNAPVHISTQQANAAPTLVISSHGREESETYTGIVAALNQSLRVIRGRCGLQ